MPEGQHLILVDLSLDELPRLLVIEFIGISAVGLVRAKRMPALALTPQHVRCVLCALV